MDMKLEMDGEVAVLIPEGNLVASKVESFNSRIEMLVGKDFRFVLLDMSRIDFIDSSGLDAVMMFNKRATGGGGILVCAALKDNVQKVFRVTWADQKIPVAATRSDGLQMMRELRAV